MRQSIKPESEINGTQKISGNVTRESFSMKDAGAVFPLAVFAYFAFMVVLVIVLAVGTAAFGLPDMAKLQKESFGFYIVTGASLQAVLFLMFYLYCRLGRISPIKAACVKNIPARSWLLSGAAAVAALFGLMFTSFAFGLLFTDVFGYVMPEAPAFDTAGRAVLGIIFMGVFPAVTEELIFRGVMLRGLAPLGRTKAVLISAAAFSLMHMSPAQTVHQFLLGIVMGLIAWETGSILAPMLIHFLNNALSIITELCGFTDLFADMRAWQIILTAAATFCLTCGIMYIILRYIKKSAAAAPPHEAFGQNSVPYANPPEPPVVRGGDAPAKKKLTDDKNALIFLLIGFGVTAAVWIYTMIISR